MAGQTYRVLSYGEEANNKAACGHCVEHLGEHAVLSARARNRGAENSLSKRTGGYQERQMRDTTVATLRLIIGGLLSANEKLDRMLCRLAAEPQERAQQRRIHQFTCHARSLLNTWDFQEDLPMVEKTIHELIYRMSENPFGDSSYDADVERRIRNQKEAHSQIELEVEEDVERTMKALVKKTAL